MRINKIALALSLAAFAMPLAAFAQDTPAAPEATADQEAVDQEQAPEAVAEEESSSNLSWNLGVTTDYVFRGITQTDFDPAVQGGLDYAFGDSGFYAGVWASNVDFADPDGPDIEVDATIGYSFDLAEDWNIDLHAVRYVYLGERDAYGSIDYNEYFAALAWSEMLTFTVAYSDDYANAGFSSMYYNLGGSWELGNEFAINAAVGHTDYADDNGSYNDWNVGVSRQFGPVNAALNYYDTSGDYVDDVYGGDRASDAVVLTLALGG